MAVTDKTYTVEAADLLDQFGEAFLGTKTLVWTIPTPVTGVTVTDNGNAGCVVHIDDTLCDAPPFNIVLRVTDSISSVYVEKTISVSAA